MPDKNVRIHELLDYIRNGRIMDAMKEFYAEGVVMTEPAYGATVGLAANLEREQKFVDSVKAFKSFETPAIAVGDGVAIYENTMSWTTVDDQDINVEQAVVQKWEGGKIVHERFYYATS
ncbi:MAG: nuclear transport factor 2 family protein [Planctomycetota bacterium]